jgi:hypothetical protein
MRSRRGTWLVIGMLALGGLMLAGLYLAPRPPKPPASATAPVTPP